MSLYYTIIYRLTSPVPPEHRLLGDFLFEIQKKSIMLGLTCCNKATDLEAVSLPRNSECAYY